MPQYLPTFGLFSAYPPQILTPLNQTLRVVLDRTVDIDCVVKVGGISCGLLIRLHMQYVLIEP